MLSKVVLKLLYLLVKEKEQHPIIEESKNYNNESDRTCILKFDVTCKGTTEAVRKNIHK